jgi:ribonuclease HI
MDGKNLTSTKNAGEQKFYAVQNGLIPGVYTEWTQAQAQIRGVKKPRHKKFSTRAEAEAFVAAGKKLANGFDIAEDSNLTSEEEIRRLIVRNTAPGIQLNGTYNPTDKIGVPYEPGRRPLPPGAEDGYDPNVKLSAEGTIVDRTEQEKMTTKLVPKIADPPGMLHIYTDGSSLSNGQAGARAGVGVYFGPQDPKYANPPSNPSSRTLKHKPLRYAVSKETQPLYTMDWAARKRELKESKPENDGEGENEEEEVEEKEKLTNWRYRNVSEALKGSKQTNQRAELTAILRALDIAPRHREVTIYTDSKYSIDCVTNWYKNWKRNGWVNSKGKPVENKDLVMDIRARIEDREQLSKTTYFVWVKGHQNNAGNIAADRLAVEGALSGKRGDAEGGDYDDGEDDVVMKKESVQESVEKDEEAEAFDAMARAVAEDSDDEFK